MPMANSSTRSRIFHSDPIPDDLKALDQWLVWRIEIRNDAPTKVPYSVAGSRASVSEPATWCSFEQAVDAFETDSSLSGVGFVFTADDPFCGIDLDKAFDHDVGTYQEWALEIVEELQSYTEVSQSGFGFHILVRAALSGEGRRKGQVEMYDAGRYFAITGDRWPDTPADIRNRQTVVDSLYKRFFSKPKPTRPIPPNLPQDPIISDDRELIEKALAAKNGTAFGALWRGDWGRHGTQSEADSALCLHLAFWTGRDSARIDRLFRQSGLYRDKWDAKRGEQTYGERTIQGAVDVCREVYSGPKANIYRLHDEQQQEKIREEDADVYETPVEKCRALNDVGNASRFSDQWRSRVRYVHEYGQWLYYKGVRWHRDTEGEVWRMARGTARAIYKEAAEADDEEKASRISKHAHRTQSKGSLRAMVELAQSETGITISQDKLDKDPYLIGCVNGIIDLKTGQLRSGKPDDYISKAVPIAFDASAECPTWLKFISEIMGGREELISYLKRAIGYALTGLTDEQCMFILHGVGSNGKSTFLDTVLELLGNDYAKQAAADILVSKPQDRHPTEIADLRGARLVAAQETAEGRKLDENLVKQMTGGDLIKARFMRQDFFQFRPEFKLFLSTNHKPVVRGTDLAIWRRLHLIPFDVVFENERKDKAMPKRLRHELPGILQWAISGCLEWQKRGLLPPDEVLKATEQYRNDMDVLATFLDECCRVDKTMRATSKELYQAYANWCDENGERCESQRKFGERLTERGFTRDKGAKGVRIWWGLGLLATGDF